MVNSNEKEKILKFKPNKHSYTLFGGFGISFLIILFILILLGYFISGFNIIVLYIIVGILVLISIILFLISVCYKKEEYIFSDNKLIYNYGTIFSDNSVEINIDKIVQVHAILGFMQNIFFKTGTILIKTAGSSQSKLILKNINLPMEVYDIIQEKMRKNGYHLKKDKLVQTAKPHWLGVIGEVFSRLFGIIILGFIFGRDLLLSISSGMLIGMEFYLFFGAIIFLGIFVLILIFSYLDLKRRRYDIFTDSVFYTEGFLTRNYSFLPMETIADTENHQGFFSKIFGLHDIVVSSEGVNNNVVFKNMTDGEQMIKNIKYLKNSITRVEKESFISKNHEVENNKEDIIGFKDQIEEPLNYDKSFKGEYKMSLKKAIITSLPLLITGPFYIVILIFIFIRVSYTKYSVGDSSIEMRYEFLTNKHATFTVDKITEVIIRESFIDKWLGTCSIVFLSIGSSGNITFSGIAKTDKLEENILAKVGINKGQKFSDLGVNFNLCNYIKHSVWTNFFISILLLSNISIVAVAPKAGFLALIGSFVLYAILYFAIYFYKTIFYKPSRYINRLHIDFIESIRGIFFVSKYYSLLRHIKGQKAIKYPLTDTGTLHLDIAGEQLVQQGNNQAPQIISNHITIPYIDNVYEVQENLDNILNSKPIDKSLLRRSNQDVANSILWLIIFGLVIIFPMILTGIVAIWLTTGIIFLLLISWIAWFIKLKSFNFEKNRVLSCYGIVFRTRHSILYKKFNFIEKNQGFTNKVFKNGKVRIYTLGSGNIEMNLSDMSDFQDVYNLLKKD